MRLPAMIATTGLTVALAACNTTGTIPAPREIASSGSPAAVADYDWFFHESGTVARLAYGLEESDDLRIGLDCTKNTGVVSLSAVAPTGAAHEIHLESGGETERYSAEAQPSEINDGLFLSADAKTGDPVFQRFRRVGWLAVWEGEERHAYAPHPGSAPRIERFFAFCG